jgi:hypothetical protein
LVRTGLPSTFTVYVTLLTSSTESVQLSSNVRGPYERADSAGALGGVASHGVLYVTVLLSPERLPFVSTA